ncbi:MAG: hypothetical protein ACRBCI_05750 [Cellvibrionaceae bacterium]
MNFFNTVMLTLFSTLVAISASAYGAYGLPDSCRGESFPTDNRECLISLAQQGGYVLYTRHVRTETDFADQDDTNFDIANCTLQRAVSDEGWQQAIELRDAIYAFDIRTNRVVSSQFCRAWQTAVQMYGHLNKKTPRLNFIQEVECAAEADLQACLDRKATDNLHPLLSKRVSKYRRKNRALVAHDDPFKSATGYYPFPMGATYLIKPKGKRRGFEVVGCISPDAWFGDAPEFACNLDTSLTADDFDEGVPEGDPL